MTASESLQWLFTAYFQDGSEIAQTPEDRSVTNHGTAFTDVLRKEQDSPLIRFELVHVDGQQVAYVDLRNGYFVVNGTPIIIHDQFFEADKHDLRLIYFRETRIVTNLDEDGKTVNSHFVNRYFFGWQTTVDGKNIKHTLAVG
jgi:hypothetical protein